jgi:hypothetical protein
MNTRDSAPTLFAIGMALLIVAALTVVPDHLNGSMQVQAEYTGFRQLFGKDSAPDNRLTDARLTLPAVGGSGQ